MLLLLAVAAAGCTQGREASPRPELEASTRAEAAEQPVLAEVPNQSGSLAVQVLDVRRVAPDTVRVEFAVVNRLAATATPTELTTAQEAVTALAGISLLSADGRRRLFPLRDTAGRMVWSGLELPAPGQRRRVWVHFPAPSAEKAGEKPRITLVLPGWTPIRDVPVS